MPPSGFWAPGTHRAQKIHSGSSCEFLAHTQVVKFMCQAYLWLDQSPLPISVVLMQHASLHSFLLRYGLVPIQHRFWEEFSLGSKQEFIQSKPSLSGEIWAGSLFNMIRWHSEVSGSKCHYISWTPLCGKWTIFCWLPMIPRKINLESVNYDNF